MFWYHGLILIDPHSEPIQSNTVHDTVIYKPNLGLVHGNFTAGEQTEKGRKLNLKFLPSREPKSFKPAQCQLFEKLLSISQYQKVH